MVRFWSSPTTKDAYRLSWVSLVLTLLAGAAGIVFFLDTGSSLCLVFGLENCVDFVSSAVVLWRFFAPWNLSDDLEARLKCREKRASVAISLILLVLGLFIIGAAIADFARREEDVDELKAVKVISFFSFLIFAFLSLFKFRYANALDSASLYKDGICSLIGTVLAGALFVNTLIIDAHPQVWWLDPLVALLCGFAALIFGIVSVYRARYRDQLPIFSCAWWFTSQGDGMDEMGPQKPQQRGSTQEMAPTDMGSDDGDSGGDIV